MKKALKILSLFLMILLLAVTYGIVRSYGWPVINSYDIPSEKILESKKICVIGDLHSKNFSTLVSQINEQKPDIILMAGDIFDASDTELRRTLNVITELADTHPVYYAMGNHELKLADSNPEFMRKLELTGVQMIDKEYFDVSEDLRIGGMYDYPFGWNVSGYNTADSAPEVVKTFLHDFANTDRFTLFAAHRPDSFYYGDASEVYPIDLVVSAHMHGGQAVIPLIGGLYGGDLGLWPEYTHGYYEKNNIRWLITSGLSTSKKLIPRFNNPPEIMIIRLISGD